MKMIMRKIMHAGITVTSLDDYFHSYFAMNANQLAHLEGSLNAVMSAGLTQMLKIRNCKCPRVACPAFRKLAQVILYENPTPPEPTEVEVETETPNPRKP